MKLLMKKTKGNYRDTMRKEHQIQVEKEKHPD